MSRIKMKMNVDAREYADAVVFVENVCDHNHQWTYTTTPTGSAWDITMTNTNGTKLPVELKARDIEYESTNGEIFIEKAKVQSLARLFNVFVITQMFIPSNIAVSFIIRSDEVEDLETRTVMARKNNITEEKITKVFYVLKADKGRVKECDLSNYWQYYSDFSGFSTTLESCQ